MTLRSTRERLPKRSESLATGATWSRPSGRGLLPRAISRTRRELALLMARSRWPRVRFGPDCDIRRGLVIDLRPGGKISFGERCILDRHLTIECAGELLVGARTIFGHHCTIAANESVRVGDDCLIAEMVSIRDHDHATLDTTRPYRTQDHLNAAVVIGNNVWLGSKVVVTRGVQIGDNAVVGAGAVVTRDVPSNSVAVGVPARVVRELARGN
jgi:acetyltransferase-like isoleucine patch superfamily enzyme